MAMPGMADRRLDKSVIYLCAHNDKTGAMGLVVNKFNYAVSFVEILTQLGLPLGDLKTYPPVFWGGSADTMRGFVLHSHTYKGLDTTPVTETTSVTATMDILEDIVAGKVKDALIAVGCMRWAQGQLEAEIAGNSWLVLDLPMELVLSKSIACKWTDALATLDISPSSLSMQQGSV